MKLYNRNGKIYADFSVNGKRYRRGLDLAYTRTNLNHAMRNVLPALIDEIEMTNGLKTEYNLSQIIGLLKPSWQELKPNTQKSYLAFSKLILKHMPDKNVKEYKIADIDAFVEKLASLGYSSQSQKVATGLLRACFDMAIRLEATRFNPVFKPDIKATKKIKRVVYTKAEARLLLENANPSLQKFLYFAIYTGARANEILALNWQDIKDDYIIISKTFSSASQKMAHSPKNGKSRVVFLAPALRQYLSSIGAKEGVVFKQSYGAIRIQFKSLCEELGLDYAGLHSLRHTFASLLLNDKVEPYVISQALGHKDLKMLENIYGHFTGYDEIDKALIAKSLNF